MTDANRRTARTVFAYVVSLAAALPLIIEASGIPEATAGAGALLAVGAAVTRILALPAVDALLPSWLRKDADKPSK
ncbi:hypothetical protein [Streptomyces sp. NPDC048157]|uniref:hypothetical protein n=1 Tax=Streptomyces sp. NPDC048157 TaxID=3365503 RepID=UPI00371A0491